MNTNFNINEGCHLEVRVVAFCIKNNQLHALLIPAPNRKNINLSIPGIQFDSAFTLEEIASRCLIAYTGVQDAYLEQLFTYADLKHNNMERVISIVYFAIIPTDKLGQEQQSTSNAQWLPVERKPASLTDHHVLDYAIRRLRYKLEYTAIGFELVPEQFTLSQLQHTYEIILGETLDKRNFRRRILKADIIEPTNQKHTGEGRPAILYRYQPDAIAEIKARRLFP